ncbi:MAG TPA: hypothetical protein VEZ47_09385 [Gemmatirosa sp.]|nr:hypothetical protein [Gemmatirosa sp.]
MRPLHVVLLALVMALATALLGWWSVPLTAALVAAAAHARPGALTQAGRSVAGGAGIAGALAWGGLLAVAAVAGTRFGAVAAALAGVLSAPAVLAAIVTLVLPALLAWSAAGLVEGVLARLFPEGAGPPHGDDGGDRRRPRAPRPPPVRAPRRPVHAPDADAPTEPELAGVS